MKKLAFLLLLLTPLMAHADCDLPAIISGLRPGATFRLEGRTYGGLIWLDVAQIKPTQAEVDAACADANAPFASAINSAKASFVNTSTGTVDAKIWRAIALGVIQLHNSQTVVYTQAQSQFDANISSAIVFGTSLVNVQNRVNGVAIPAPLTTITPAQIRTFILNQLDSGAAN